MVSANITAGTHSASTERNEKFTKLYFEVCICCEFGVIERYLSLTLFICDAGLDIDPCGTPYLSLIESENFLCSQLRFCHLERISFMNALLCRHIKE